MLFIVFSKRIEKTIKIQMISREQVIVGKLLKRLDRKEFLHRQYPKQVKETDRIATEEKD